MLAESSGRRIPAGRFFLSSIHFAPAMFLVERSTQHAVL